MSGKRLIATVLAAAAVMIWLRSFRAFRRGFVPVLAYHALSDDPAARHDYVVRRGEFERQMRWLAGRGYEAVTCDTVAACRTAGKPRNRGIVAVSFDDGFASTYHHALPVLRELGMAATVFPATDFVERGEPFPFAYAAGDLPLTPAQLSALRDAGFAIGSHSCSHPDLRRLDDAALAHELQDSHAAITRWTGAPPTAFAYPFGLYDERVKRAVAAAGYEAAFAVFAEPGQSDVFAQPRILIRNQTTLLGFRLRVWGLHPYLKTRRWFRLLRPLLRRQRWAFW